MSDKAKLSPEETAIEAIKSNWPGERYTMLCDALHVAINALREVRQLREERDKLKSWLRNAEAKEREYDNLRHHFNQLEKEHIKLVTVLEWYISEGAKGNSDFGHKARTTLSELKGTHKICCMGCESCIEGDEMSNDDLLRIAFTRELTDERVIVSAAYWLDASPHERTEADGVILARYARKAMQEIEQLKTENTGLKAFYNYWASLYGDGLGVANWHQNGDVQPFDSFFDAAQACIISPTQGDDE